MNWIIITTISIIVIIIIIIIIDRNMLFQYYHYPYYYLTHPIPILTFGSEGCSHDTRGTKLALLIDIIKYSYII